MIWLRRQKRGGSIQIKNGPLANWNGFCRKRGSLSVVGSGSAISHKMTKKCTTVTELILKQNLELYDLSGFN